MSLSKNKTTAPSVLPLRGMLDFPPKLQEQYRFIKNQLAQVAEWFGYEEYDLPILEAFSTFERKSSPEILSQQTFNFSDRGGRRVLLRPEITPSLARLAAKETGNNNQSPLPLRWYTVGRCYRYERPQKGRLREFQQLNFDLLGKAHPWYDAELLEIVVSLLDAFKVPRESYEIRLNHRGFTEVILDALKFGEKKPLYYRLTDGCRKMNDETWEREVQENDFTEEQKKFLTICRADARSATAPADKKFSRIVQDKCIAAGIDHDRDNKKHQPYFEFAAFLTDCLDESPFIDRLVHDFSIVRGFDYYTGLVFEVFAKEGEIRRSLFAGGRYDNLVEKYGSAVPLSGVGFGMGIEIFRLFLQEKNLPLKEQDDEVKRVYLGALEGTDKIKLVKFLNELKQKLPSSYSILQGTPSKERHHYKKAKQHGCSCLALIGERELEEGSVVIADLKDKTRDYRLALDEAQKASPSSW